MDLRQVFGSNIRRLREKRGLSQSEFARELGIAQTQLSSVENGRTGFTSDTINRYSEALECSPVELFYVEQVAPEAAGSGEKVDAKVPGNGDFSTVAGDRVSWELWLRLQEELTLLAAENRKLRAERDSLVEKISDRDLQLFKELKEKAPPGFLEGLLNFDRLDFITVMRTIADAFPKRTIERADQVPKRNGSSSD